MDSKLQINTRNIPPALLPLSRKPMVQYLASGQMDKASALMPTRIEHAAKGTPIAMVTLVVEPVKVEAFIVFELTKKVLDMFNGDPRLNLQPHQLPTIARGLIENYKNETLADFSVCFQRGMSGLYGDIFRIDIAIINGWMQKYLEEKYQIIEDTLVREKENQYRPVVPENSDRDWLSEWQKAIESSESTRMASQLTQEQIEAEGQEKPKKESYPKSSRNEVELKLLHLQYIRANYDARTAEPLETWIPEKEWLESL
jgi:hypothetical protein